MPPSHKRTAPAAARAPRAKRRRPVSGPPTPHGSYARYYDRRDLENDPRLAAILPVIQALPEAPALLDVGCNVGKFTALVASAVNLAEATGIDLDPALVEKAARAARAKQAAACRADVAADAFSPLSCRVVQRGFVAGSGEGECGYPFNVSFAAEDFASVVPGIVAGGGARFDVVLCLSVTKWVHLDGGDAALMRLFHRMFAVLRPGGVLVLEPQPKISYKRARRKGMGTRTFREMEIRPDQFADVLVKDVGFERVSVLREVMKGQGKAFNRPILAFYKAGGDNGVVNVDALGEERVGTLTGNASAGDNGKSDSTSSRIVRSLVKELLESVEKRLMTANDKRAASKREIVNQGRQIETVKPGLDRPSPEQVLGERTT